jgi:acyl dehydratase
MIVNALVSTVMGTQLPGNGTVLMDQQVKYCGPVFAEDEVSVTLTFKEYEERNQFYIGTFEGVCHTQDGREVLVATCHQLMSKKIFEVTEG